MTFIKTAVMLGLAALAATAAPVATAEGTGTGWYGGANIGRTGATIDDERIRSGVAGQGLGTASIEDRDQDKGYKILGGYQFNRNFAVEAGFFDLGSFGYTAHTTPTGSLTGDVRIKGVNLDLVGIFPLTEKWSLLGRVGATSARTNGSFSATGAGRVPYANANPRERAVNPKVGVGVMYDFNESWALRGEAERYRINDAVGNKGDVDMLSIGLIYRFGAKPQTRVAAVAAPAPAPAPAPVVVAAPAPVAVVAPTPAPVLVPILRVSLSADSLFDFDKSAIKPAGRQSLDKLANELKGARYDTIVVTGHTDRLGTSKYNEALSTRRAVAVSDYLVQTGGVPAGKVAARGLGESGPVTRDADCKGAKQTPALIACLQADRRVEVEVSATNR